MARWSRSAEMIKLENDDKVSIMGVKGKVVQVLVMRPEGLPADVLVSVDLSNGRELPNVFNLSEIEAVRVNQKWMDFKAQPVMV
jgi:hypothetical protein